MKSLMNTLRTALPAAAMVAAGLASSAQAGDEEGRYAVKGIGLMPCKTFVEAAQQGKPEASGVVAWLDGYTSGINMLLDNTYDLVTWQDGVLPNMLAATCAQMPDQPVAVASGQIIQVLGAQRLQQAETPATITVGEQKRLLYPTVVRAMQQRLKNRGINVTVDGDFGPGTQRALSGFQTSNNIPATGFPDPRTMVALFATEPGQ